MRRRVIQIILTLLLMGTIIQTTTLIFPLEIKGVNAVTYPSYTTILPNGTVVNQPPNPIQQNADNYTYLLTGPISGYGIVIERNNMTLDGNGYTITGTTSQVGIGINVTGQSQVLLNDLQVYAFHEGVEFAGSSYCQLYDSNMSDGDVEYASTSIGTLVLNSTNITLFHDEVSKINSAYAYGEGIWLNGSSFCTVFNCTAEWSGNYNQTGSAGYGIELDDSSSNNLVFDNWVSENHDGIGIRDNSNYNSLTNNQLYGNAGGNGVGAGIETFNTMYDAIYKNSISGSGTGGNAKDAGNTTNTVWDGGQPSYSNGGNQWGDYNGTYNESTDIGETPYVIDTNNQDNYPLEFYNYTYVYLTVQSAGDGTADPRPDTYPVPYPGMNMTITPLAAPGYVFSYWLEDGSSKEFDNPITIAMDSNHTLEAYFAVKTGGGCPYVSDWNGSGYVLDNNILPASENGNGTDTKDYYLLQQPLAPFFSTQRGSLYSLQISEFESNIDYIDQVKLMAVDHSQGTNVAVTQDGEIFAYNNLVAPVSCVDNDGKSELTKISTINGNISDPSTFYQGNKGDWLLLNFGRVTGPHANLVLRDDEKCSECIDVQVPNATGGWQTIDVLNPRDFWSMEAVNMSAYLPASGDFIVRLLWTQSHRLDYVGLDTSAPAPAKVISAPPTLAIHSTLGDVTQKLLYDDEQCVQLVNGQNITIWFTLPNQPQGTTRNFILFTDGYYYTIT
jgi:parallel beta-helix repeat protein